MPGDDTVIMTIGFDGRKSGRGALMSTLPGETDARPVAWCGELDSITLRRMKLLHLAKRAAVGTGRRVLHALIFGILGGVLVAIIGGVVILEQRPDLEVWHTARLDEEFEADSDVRSFEDYLALEERLFAQLEERVYSKVRLSERHQLDRFTHGSRSDPGRWPVNWNRTFELQVEDPRAAVLMLHGMSDSPYSMRSLGELLHAQGHRVVGLRVPGHGTAPSGLVRVEWEDMAAAVELAMEYLHEQVPGKPLYIVGYSNGGALAVHYALQALEHDSLPPVAGLVLMSPEIGITKLAALAAWQERLGHLLGLSKLSWNSILPEYDPFKYGSFALNAGKQAYLITQEIQSRIARLGDQRLLDRFPPMLAFQSVVDATVTAPVLVDGLFRHLPQGDHELVLFDINRFVRIESILNTNPGSWLDGVFNDQELAFDVVLITNESPDSEQVVARHQAAGDREITDVPLGLAWPEEVYSLSHVALPFPPDDPLYGGPDAGESPGVKLGNLALRGERGELRIAAADLLRLRWNPFHAYIEQRTLEFVR